MMLAEVRGLAQAASGAAVGLRLPGRPVLLALAAAAVGLLVAAEFSTISYRSIGIGACSTRENPGICATPAHAQHGYALVIGAGRGPDGLGRDSSAAAGRPPWR